MAGIIHEHKLRGPGIPAASQGCPNAQARPCDQARQIFEQASVQGRLSDTKKGNPGAKIQGFEFSSHADGFLPAAPHLES
jgi:hypothetical protein